ncbi:hypothetical protein D9754_11375 [Planomicrobium sp. Y74]|nr:hypothetical protein D9754_11375 [Planomicrobium sp. Y74]
MAFFAIDGEAEATRGAGRWSLDKEKRRHPYSSEKHKTDQRSGLGHAAELAYDSKSWVAGV